MRRKQIPILLIAALAGGCGGEDGGEKVAVQRDVYTRIEDCIADWGNKDLCLEAEKLRQQQAAHAQAHGSPIIVSSFYGPEYMPGYRYAYSPDGAYFRPRTNSAASATAPQKASTAFTQGRSAAAAKAASGVRSSGGSSSRGGFGGTGRAASSGSGS